MKPFIVRPAGRLSGRVRLPGDKSIAHRAVIFSALSPAKTSLENFPFNDDCITTLNAFRKLGISSGIKKSKVTIHGRGLFGLRKPKGPIFLSESGTSMRLMLGVLAGQRFSVKLIAGRSLSKRPMARIIVPLRKMGAVIKSKAEEFAPITIQGGNLKGITYRMPVASAQVKSAILIAGLYAKGKTKVIEPVLTRDHTERMMKVFRGRLLKSPGKVYIPGDISSAAFFMAAGALLSKANFLIEDVSLNPTRIGAVRVLKKMGANIKIKVQGSKLKGGEPRGSIRVKSGKLKGVKIKKNEIPSLIDELPVLMVAASLAKGKSIFEGVGELRVKETDRIRSMAENLRKMGAKIKIRKIKGAENIIINGVKGLKGAKVRSFGDHRTAMSMIVAGLAAKGETRIDEVSCISKSFPDFIKVISSLRK